MKTITLILALLFALPAMAQTTVTATITDSDGQTWNNGHGFATFQPGPINAYKCASTITSPTSFTLDGSGSFSVSLADNTLCNPVGSTWAFTICPNASAKCYTSQQTVFGATQNLTTLLSGASVAPRFAATSSVQSYGYLDGEVTPIPVPGGWYFNVTEQKARQWNGTAWQDFGGGGGTIGGSTTANEGVGTTGANNTLSPVAETGYETVGGVTTYTCNEDHNKGIWDVRCHGWAANPSTALTNTIQLAMCYFYTTASAYYPTIELPGGQYSLGGNISIPPNIDVEGTGGTEFGTQTRLTTTDTTQPMMTQVSTQTFTCNGTPHTDTGNGGTIGNMWLIGGGSTASTDEGINDLSTGSNIHNISFTNFGGPGRTASGGLNSSGNHLFAQANLQWYYFSGAYNSSGFTDTNPHGQLELTNLDSQWSRLVVYGNLQDSGYYNRYYLTNVIFAGNSLTDSFIQIGPHDLWLIQTSAGATITGNRFDDGWWDSVHIPSNNNFYSLQSNSFLGYCTSPTLNPANFPSNPGGVTTDPNCSAIESFNLGSIISDNGIGESGLWSSWKVYDVFAGANIIGGLPTIIRQPNQIIGGAIGATTVNPGADISGSMYGETWPVFGLSGTQALPLTNTTGLGGLHYAHFILADGAATNFTSFTGGFQDSYITIEFTPGSTNDTITPSATISTCSGGPITTGLHWFYIANLHLSEMCPSTNLKGTTGTITGTSLSASCDSGTATVTGATAGQAVAASSTTGADVGGAFNLRASVTSANTVTVYVCGTGTPASLAYNVVVQSAP